LLNKLEKESTIMPISLHKIEQTAPALVNLAKTAQKAIDGKRLQGQKSKLGIAFDYSGSMFNQYKDGTMQRLAEKLLALGTQIDDDGAIDLFVFDTEAAYLGEVNIHNYQGAIERYTNGRRMGTTNYAAAFKLIEKHYGFGGNSVTASPETSAGGLGGLFGKKKPAVAGVAATPLTSPANEPVLILFLTDGAPNNRNEAVQTITDASYSPIFWQFLSIGAEPIPFLEKLDDLDGRYIDNADYKPVGNVDTISDATLFDLILDEYPAWVLEERRRGQIV
jgi:hypothetical protein